MLVSTIMPPGYGWESSQLLISKMAAWTGMGAVPILSHRIVATVVSVFTKVFCENGCFRTQRSWRHSSNHRSGAQSHLRTGLMGGNHEEIKGACVSHRDRRGRNRWLFCGECC